MDARTERTSLEREIELLAAAQELAQLGSFQWDVRADAATWTDELYRLYGIAPGTAITRELYLERIHPEDRAQVQAAIGRCLQEQIPYDHDYRIVRDSGEVRWVHGRGRPVLGPDGAVSAIHGTCHDVTERKRTERALAEAQAKLERAESARRQAADINDNIIHSLVQAMQAMDSRDTRGARDALRQTLEHASRIVTELEEGLPRRPTRP